ncbi:MAG: tRNA pseudouridine(38-40) synthase TruA [Alphaproteobacteria bacterium]
MGRWKLTVEYDGRAYVGWQRQDNGPSVQAALEAAVGAFCGESVTVWGAGRTDAGVHAAGQVCHVDLARSWPAKTVRDAINYHLGDAAIAVVEALAVAGDFDARFSATERRYCYRLVNRRARLALDAGRAWHVPQPLDAVAMDQAARVLEGRHDFTSFRSVHCQAQSPVRTLDRLRVTRRGAVIEIEARARSFLHNQVRIMAGSLKLVGEGKWSAGDMAAALAAKSRARAGPTAPAAGLTLVAVVYGAVGNSVCVVDPLADHA